MAQAWRKLRGASAAELRPAHTLLNGQCFGWRPHELRENEYVGVIGNRVIAIRQTEESTEYKALHGGSTGIDDELHDYFQLSTPLVPLYSTWANASCPRMQTITQRLSGLRILRQDPAECLFSFITSSNNNVPRITLILDRIREKYGTVLCAKTERAPPATDSSPLNSSAAASPLTPSRNKLMPRMEISNSWYSFPTVERLAQVSEDEYRKIGLGYRAKFIRNSAIKLVAAAAEQGHADGSAYLHSLRNQSRKEVMTALLELDGVGPKVADCVALFSLDQVSAVPVDTHVWRIACRDYDTTLSECKSLTPTVYQRVGDLFRTRFGAHAGWAHQLLFAAELKEFRGLLPPLMLQQMEEAKILEKQIKAREKEEKEARKSASVPNTPGSAKGSTSVTPTSASASGKKSKPRSSRKKKDPEMGQSESVASRGHKRQCLAMDSIDE